MNTVELKTEQRGFFVEPWRMLLWLLIAQLMVAFVGRSLGPLGILIGEDLSLSKAEIGLLPSALFIGQAIASIPVGFMADFIGSRRLLLMLSLCLGVSFLIMTMLTNFIFVLLLVLIGGLGYGAMHPTSNRGIIYWFSQTQRGTAMGIKQMGITFGSALAGFLLLPLSATFGWRPVLLTACVGLIITGFVAFAFYRDPMGSLKPRKKEGISFFIRALAEMAKNKPLLLVSLSAMGLNGSQMCLNTYIVLFAYEKMGISLFLSGILLVISEVSGSLGRIGWGIISDKLFNGRRLIILMIIAILAAIASTIVAFLPEGTPFLALVLVIILFGFCVSGFNGIWMNIASELVPKEQTGLSSGYSITLGSMGVIFVPPIFGLMVDQNGHYTAGWLSITAIMGMVIVLLSILSYQVRKSRLRGS
ncbi:MFS transporter [Pseudalkalibacillus salsuginis]|uniref:MFS transporter n=1 Tax=Pseudalkalibacillus salsuginis TaxID=2910972 RepID=UPI001F2C4DAB|nr:MFS transporter [Pseudalkalibacillus salsuginis]MCF6411588.1 MFS transporter [Pseudalkalibacillus salsuginis]